MRATLPAWPRKKSDGRALPWRSGWWPETLRAVCARTRARVRVRAYVRGNLHACMRACVLACLRACMLACLCACVHLCVRAFVRTCVCVCVSWCVCMCVRVCRCMSRRLVPRSRLALASGRARVLEPPRNAPRIDGALTPPDVSASTTASDVTHHTSCLSRGWRPWKLARALAPRSHCACAWRQSSSAAARGQTGGRVSP